MAKKKEPIFEIINNNNDMQMNKIIKKIIYDTLKRNNHNIFWNPKTIIEMPSKTNLLQKLDR